MSRLAVALLTEGLFLVTLVTPIESTVHDAKPPSHCVWHTEWCLHKDVGFYCLEFLSDLPSNYGHTALACAIA